MTVLSGKTAIVTGAARGLGRSYALRLGALGANVAVLDRDLHSYEEFDAEREQMGAETTADEIAALGVESMGLTVDVGDRDSVQAAIAQVIERWHRIDVVVCNAGGGSGALDGNKASEVDPDELDVVWRRNFLGTVNTCVAVSPTMKAQRSGKIITVASRAGLIANRDGSYAHYGAAKAAIVMYTRFLAQDLGPFGVTANCIAPGFIGTGRLMVGFEERGVDRISSRVALRRLGTPEDCANVLEFLSSPLSDYVTSVVIPVDGGSGIS